VLGEINGALISLAYLFVDSRDRIAGVARTFAGGALARLGWEARPGEPANVKSLRSSLLATLALLVGDPEAIAFLGRLWEGFRADRSSLDPNLIAVTFRAAARHSGAFDELVALARDAERPDVKSTASIALGYAPEDKWDEVLRIGINAPLQDVVWYLIGVAINPLSGRKLWDFLKENWARLDEMFGTMSFNIPQLIEHGTAALRTEEGALEVEQFFKEHPTDIALQPAQEAVETIRNRAAVLARDAQGETHCKMRFASVHVWRMGRTSPSATRLDEVRCREDLGQTSPYLYQKTVQYTRRFLNEQLLGDRPSSSSRARASPVRP
jgi:hypothetical protein